MGGLTTNRKRGEDYCKSPAPIAYTFDYFSVPKKKPRIPDSMDQNSRDFSRRGHSDSVVSRISRYPDSKPLFHREIHAPVRCSSFGLSTKASNAVSSSSQKSSADNLFGKYKNARDIAMGSLRYFSEKGEVRFGKERKVITIDEDDEDVVCVSDDSSVEEVKTVGEQFRSVDSSVVTDLSNADLKVDALEKKMSLMQLEHLPDSVTVPVHRKLYDSATKKSEKLIRLTDDIGYYERRLKLLQLLHPQKEAVQPMKDVTEECFVPLSDEDEAEVSRAMSKCNRRTILVSHDSSNIDITGEKLLCLSRGGWLNDEVINLYLELLKEREKREPEKFLKCHFFNTFFYKKLIAGSGSYNFQSVRRWTTRKKLGYSLSDCDKIFVPIHKEIHWCLAIIDKKDKKFQYLDSLRGNDSRVMQVLAKYFVDELKDKNEKVLDVSSWEQELVEELPEQRNGFDCGMFMLKYIDFYSRDIGLSFSQKHMPYFRQRTAKEILRLKAN